MDLCSPDNNASVLFAKKKQSVTYLISDADDGSILSHYSLHRYQQTKRIYSEMYPLYNREILQEKPDKVIIEDSNSAYEFFRVVCNKDGKSSI